MREIQDVENGEAKAEVVVGNGPPDIGPSGRVDRIRSAFRSALAKRDSALIEAGDAIGFVIQCGHELIEAKREHSGEFLLWLEVNLPEISHDTANRYMKVAGKHYAALRNGSLDFQTLKDLYIACGIMPEPEGKEPTPPGVGSPPAWARWTQRIDGLIETLDPKDKQELRTWCQSILKRI